MHLHPFVRVNALPALLCVRLTLQRTNVGKDALLHLHIFLCGSIVSAIMRILSVRNLRGIPKLDFTVPDKPGAYLLTGANGAGKSTVLSCLAQLGDPDALDRFFTPDIRFSDSDADDVYQDSSIRFEADGKNAEFRYRSGHWHAVAGTTEEARELFGFSRVVFAGEKRKVFPEPGEMFSIRSVRGAPDILRSVAAEIFDDEKFRHLHIVKSEITGTEFFLLRRFEAGEERYYSENNFGSGERAVLRLIAQIQSLPPSALILLDESEMALHPRARKRLWEYLSRTAVTRSFVILVSTQSASLIRGADRGKILLLENDGCDGLVCRSDVYPAAVLGEMALPEDILPEILLLVEDQEASMLLDAIVEKLRTCMDREFPYCRILPVGGYMQVVILMDNLSRVLPAYIQKRAVLDRDAKPFIAKALESPGRPHFDVVERNRNKIFYLPCAPEQGVIRLLENDVRGHSRGLSKLFRGRSPHLEDIVFHDARYRAVPGTNRSDCKEKLSLIVHGIVKISGEPESYVRKKLYRYYADNRYRNTQELKEDYCPLIFQQ